MEKIRKLESLLIDGTAGDFRFNWQSLLKQFPFAAPTLETEPVPKPRPVIVRAARAMPI
jgi:hypothetical protein